MVQTTEQFANALLGAACCQAVDYVHNANTWHAAQGACSLNDMIC
jgi:hypothetical protein